MDDSEIEGALDHALELWGHAQKKDDKITSYGLLINYSFEHVIFKNSQQIQLRVAGSLDELEEDALLFT